MIALVDLDIIKYSCGFACQATKFSDGLGTSLFINQCKGGMSTMNLSTEEKTIYKGLRSKKAVLEEIGGEWEQEIIPEPDNYCTSTVKKLLLAVLRQTGATSYIGYLSKGNCFRTEIYPEYKANRIGTPKPYHLQTITDYFLRYHPTEVNEQIEADDAMAIFQSQSIACGAEETVICTLDKDLDMVPGNRWDWVKKRFSVITPEAGIHSFWRQMLTGDNADNIPGIKGLGNAKADKVFEESELDYKATVMREYQKLSFKGANGKHTEETWGEQELERNAKLLWMLRKPLTETYPGGYS